MNFIYDGNSSKDFNIVVTKVIGRHDTPERDIESVEIPGKDGSLHNDNGSYKDKKIEIECYIKDEVSKYSRLINSWLYNKFEIKELWFDDEPDIFYEGLCINKISFSETFKYFNECKITFECKPHKRLFEDNINITISGTTFYNPTDYESNPILKIYGNGDINLTINNNIINLTNVVDYVVIDSQLIDCYKDTILKNNYMSGEFPKLQAGENVISWTGTVSKIEVTPNWGCI